jgi:two-component system, cell cycle sensor histidine kinase and response regulator CckA
MLALDNLEPPQPSEHLAHVLGALTRTANVDARSVDDILRGIAETAAATLRVARVSIWLCDAGRVTLHCIEVFDARTGEHASGEELSLAECPSYFRSLELLRNIAAMQARDDPRTEELREYLDRHDITTILDVPMLRSGRVIGVVCHEHAGAPRSYGQSDRLFAGSIGDLVAFVLETAQSVELQREQSRMRESVVRMAQLQSLGWLAAGVAHDFRNLLTVVGANAELLERALAEDPETRVWAEAIQAAVGQSRELCQKLQAYAGRTPRQVELSQIDEALAGTFLAFRSRLPDNVTFQIQAGGGLRPGRLDPVELRRAVMNLLVNALESLPPWGGSISVTLSEGEPSAQDVLRGYDFRKSSAPCLMIEIADTGAGMDPKAFARVCEPFFTTKEEGSGLGLATVLGIVRDHAGVFSVDSARGRGARFKIWLPIVVTNGAER